MDVGSHSQQVVIRETIGTRLESKSIMPPADADPLNIESSVATALDVSSSERVGLMMDLVVKLSRAHDPQEVLRVFADGFRRVQSFNAYLSLSIRGLKAGQYKITRFLSDFADGSLQGVDPWSRWHEIKALRGGILGSIIAGARPVILHDLHVDHDEAVGDMLAPYRSLMAIPLFDDGQPLNWAIELDEEDNRFSVEQLEEAILRANLVGNTVRNVLIAKQLGEASSWIQREIDQIASIQRSLLPAGIPQIPGLEIATHYQTFNSAGGDLYDFMTTRPDGGAGEPDDSWGILIADASGHGPSAAVVTAMLHSIVHTFPSLPRNPAEVLEYANRHLMTKQIADSFVTAFFAMYDPSSRRLRYSRAGHPPPLLKQSFGPGGAALRIDDAGAIPLGISEDVGYVDASVQLEPGQTLVLYTDGITEANGPGGNMFGVDGIERAVKDCTGEPGCIVESIVGSLRAHQAGARPTDDQTIVAIQVEAR